MKLDPSAVYKNQQRCAQTHSAAFLPLIPAGYIRERPIPASLPLETAPSPSCRSSPRAPFPAEGFKNNKKLKKILKIHPQWNTALGWTLSSNGSAGSCQILPARCSNREQLEKGTLHSSRPRQHWGLCSGSGRQPARFPPIPKRSRAAPRHRFDMHSPKSKSSWGTLGF